MGEDMQVNGFEQMFINLTNERIQCLFNEIMFEREKKVYKDDGLDASFLKAPNNIACVQMFLKKGGVVPMLNESCSMRVEDEKVDGSHLVTKMNQKFGNKHEYYKIATPQAINKLCKIKKVMGEGNRGPGLNYEDCFSVLHYAGEVTYTVVNFVPKSRDSLETHVTKIFQESSNPFVAEMFGSKSEEAAAGGTVGTKFGHQLEELATVLSAGETLFVRCIKSNPGKQQIPVLHRQSVFEQLTRGGVIAALEIRAAGLPDQVLHEDFVKEFCLLEIGASADLKKQDNKTRATTLIKNIVGEEALTNNMVKLGTTRVFMKSGIISMLRAASRFKEHLYARRVQRLLGSSRVRKIDNLWGLIEEQENHAKGHNLLKYKSIADALDKAKAKVKPMVDKLSAAKAEHGAKNYDKLQQVMEKYMDEIKDLRPLVDAVKDAVQKMDKKRQMFKNIFDQRIGNGIQNCADFEHRVELVEKDASEMDDVADAKADVDKCRASCKQARAKLEELRNKVLPDLQSAGFDSIDLEADHSDNDPCPKVTTLLNDVEKLVVEAEKLGYETLKTKRAFMELIEQLGAEREASKQKLDDLGGDASRCAAEGMKEVASEIKKAADLAFQMDAILEKGKDPDGYKRVFTEFKEQVDKAHAAVQAGLVELERREREREARREVETTLSESLGEINEILAKLKKAVLGEDKQAEGQLEGLHREISLLMMRQEQETLDALKSKADALVNQTKPLVGGLHEKLEKIRADNKKKMEDRIKMFGGK